MRILLVSPPNVVPPSWIPYFPQEPLGLEYLAASLNGHTVRIVDCIAEYWWQYKKFSGGKYWVGASPKQLEAVIRDLKPQVVGVTIKFQNQLFPAYQIIMMTKQINRNIVTLVGGAAACSDPSRLLEQMPKLDIVVVGEGEITMRHLAICDFERLDNIPGIFYRNRERSIVSTILRRPIGELDELPFPVRNPRVFSTYALSIFNSSLTGKVRLLAPWLKYNHDWCSFGSAFLQPRAKAPPNHAAILTSRGCPYDCYFCAVHTVWGRTFRQRSIENVLAEMEELHDDYDVRTFNILDDTFNITKERVLTFCKAVLKRRWKIEIRAASGLRMSNLDIDTLKLMKAAGFKDLYFGIESGCQRVIDEVIRKKIILSEVLNIVDACHQAGIECGGYFMVGVPGESIDEMRHTISFALASGLDKARLYTCQPIPGSRLYEDCIKNGWLCGYTPADSYLFGSEGHIKTGDFSPEDVKVIAEEGKRRLRVAGMLDQKRK